MRNRSKRIWKLCGEATPLSVPKGSIPFSTAQSGVHAWPRFSLPRGDATYGGILDIAEGRMLWAKSYRGTSFTPAHIVAMDREMDEEIKALELTETSEENPRAFDFLPLLLDRTMNTFPAIRNAFTEAR